MPKYDSKFFNYQQTGAINSARAIIPVLQAQLKITSILDVGCGQGAWLKIWKELGCKHINGIDGNYIDRKSLLIQPEEFWGLNLEKPFDLNRKLDFAQCLEVGEHLPKEAANTLIHSIVKHAPIVLFSAAPPGQGGDHHINEQDYEFWRQIFKKHDYLPIDYIRHIISKQPKIEPWYRYNTLLYVSKDQIESLSYKVRACLIPDEKPIEDISPKNYKLRKYLVRRIPIPIATKIAKTKEAAVRFKYRQKTP
jgi:SAM-dependent methyltransferase